MSIFKKITSVLTLNILSFALAISAFAQSRPAGDLINSGLTQTGGRAGLDQNTTLQTQIGLIINAIFGVVGAIFLAFSIYGGYLWMTAGGSEEKVGKGKKMIVGGIEGMIIIFMSYAAVYFVINALGVNQ